MLKQGRRTYAEPSNQDLRRKPNSESRCNGALDIRRLKPEVGGRRPSRILGKERNISIYTETDVYSYSTKTYIS